MSGRISHPRVRLSRRALVCSASLTSLLAAPRLLQADTASAANPDLTRWQTENNKAQAEYYRKRTHSDWEPVLPVLGALGGGILGGLITYVTTSAHARRQERFAREAELDRELRAAVADFSEKAAKCAQEMLEFMAIAVNPPYQASKQEFNAYRKQIRPLNADLVASLAALSGVAPKSMIDVAVGWQRRTDLLDYRIQEAYRLWTMDRDPKNLIELGEDVRVLSKEAGMLGKLLWSTVRPDPTVPASTPAAIPGNQ